MLATAPVDITPANPGRRSEGLAGQLSLNQPPSCRTCKAGNEAIGGLPAQGNAALRRSPALPEGPNEHFETILRPFHSSPPQFLRHRDEHARLAHRVGSPLLLLGSHPLRNPVYGGLADSSFVRVEHLDDRHPDECCRTIPEVMVAIARADRQGQFASSYDWRDTSVVQDPCGLRQACPAGPSDGAH